MPDELYKSVDEDHVSEDFDMTAAAGWPELHKGNFGWSRMVTLGLREQVRAFDQVFHDQTTVTIAPNCSAIILANLVITRGSARFVRPLVVPPWGLSTPIAGGNVYLDIVGVQNKLVPAPVIINVSGSCASGIGYQEDYPDNLYGAGIATPLGPVPAFARTVTITVLSGTLVAIDTFPIGLVAGQSITIPAGMVDTSTPGSEFATPHTLTGGVVAV